MSTPPWRFYGRSQESQELGRILDRDRWFFASITGRRRIGKTTLVSEATRQRPGRPVFYVQIPDSEEPGIISTIQDALDASGIPPDLAIRPHNLLEFVKAIEALVHNGYIVVLDEFQYFNKKSLRGFCSLLQAMVDRLYDPARAGERLGGLIVLGSIYTEMVALLEDRSAPLFARTTDKFDLPHLDIASVLALIGDHAEPTPQRLLFLWTLFEGVPKFYRDCYERQCLGSDRATLLSRIFFESASPLRTEADNWFLHELQGRYDMVLKYVAKNPGRLHGELMEAVRRDGGKDDVQIGGYLKTLVGNFRLIERKLPVFAPGNARKGRYYLADNFLQAWLGALANPVSLRNFQAIPALVEQADKHLEIIEGYAFERLVAQLYEERSRKGLPGFMLHRRIQGYWDKSDIEIDLVAINEDSATIRFGTCKRSPVELLADLNNFRRHVDRFLDAFPRYRPWQVELVGLSPELDHRARSTLLHHGLIPEDLVDLTRGLV